MAIAALPGKKVPFQQHCQEPAQNMSCPGERKVVANLFWMEEDFAVRGSSNCCTPTRPTSKKVKTNIQFKNSSLKRKNKSLELDKRERK